MTQASNSKPPLQTVGGRLAQFTGIVALACVPGIVVLAQQDGGTATHPTHMPESSRAAVNMLVVVGGRSPASTGVTGSYAQATEGLVGGIDSGSKIGTISKEIGGVPVSFPIPILTIPGAIFGGLSGAAKREIQEFRDALTEELASADNASLYSGGLAEDVYHGLRGLPQLETRIFAPTAAIPEDTDAVLYVDINDISIDVQGKEAILTTSVRATLRRVSDGVGFYDNVVHYQDRDTLGNWTANDNALWRDYVNYARHYLGREVASEVFGKVVLQRELHPLETDTVEFGRKDPWRGETGSTTPTLAWQYELQDATRYGAWAESIRPEEINWDLEIYDARQLVYAEYGLSGQTHTITWALDGCRNYRWSVRPAFRSGGNLRYGEWMRTDEHSTTGPNGEFGIFGAAASDAPAFTRHFAALEIDCRRR